MNQDIANFFDYLKYILQRSPEVVVHQKYNMLQFYTWLKYTKQNILFDLAETTLEDCHNWIIHFSKTKIKY
jgi:hypothetical protein